MASSFSPQAASLLDLRAAYAEGRLQREDFWREMAARHALLREYQQIISGGELSAITIVADELRVTTRDGVRMVWVPEDIRSAPNEAVNYGCYEPKESPSLLAAAEGAEVVLDIGANAGWYALHFAQRLAPNGVVHAFEPVPSTYARLARNVALNGLEEVVKTHNIGVGDEERTVSFFVPQFSGSGAASMRNLHPDETCEQVTARIETLDGRFQSIGRNRLDLIKVDVEGAELSVINGGLATISRHKPMIFMELLRKWTKPFGYHPNDVIARLAGVGYQCFTFDGVRLIRFAEMTDETPQTNFLFLQPDRHQSFLDRRAAECS